MEIKDLKARQGDVDLVAEVIDKSPARTFDKFGKQGKVCNCKIKDNTGSVSLTLWNEDIDKINVGDKIKITKGYVGEWQGELQLSACKFGKIEVVEKGTAKPKQEEVMKNFEEPKEEEDEEQEDLEEEFF